VVEVFASLDASQIRTVESADPDAMTEPSCEKDNEYTMPLG